MSGTVLSVKPRRSRTQPKGLICNQCLTLLHSQDEFGNWLAYAFDERGPGGPVPAVSDWSVNSALLDSAAFKLGGGGAGALEVGGGDGPPAPGGPLLQYLHSSLALDSGARVSPPLPPKHHYRWHVSTGT